MHEARKCSMNLAVRAFALVMTGASLVASAQTYPSRTVAIIVPFSAGSGSDVFARTLSTKFSASWGQPVVVENRTGAGGVIGAQAVARAAPDGHTLLIAAITWALAPVLYAKPPYDTLRDFAAIGRIGFIPSVLVVNPSFPANDVKELIQLAKAKPGQLSYSSSGKGAPSQLFMEYFKAQAHVDIVEVPYKVTAQALTDVIGGQVHMNLPILAAALPHIRAGRLKALAVTSGARSAAAPEIPILAESAGLADFDAAQWQGVVAPAGTPAAVVARINAELNRALQEPDVKEIFGNLGVDIAPTTPQKFTADIAAYMAKWAPLIKKLNVSLD